jgi:glutathione S-transferase
VTIPNEEVANQPPVLGHWDIRGLAQAIRYQLVYSGVEFDDFYHYHSDDPALTQDSWMRKKDRLGLDFPSLPYFIDGSYKLSEHLAIHEYIADKWMPELLGKSKTARAQVSMLSGVVSGVRKFVDDVCHSGSLTQRQLSGEIISKLEPVAQMLVGRTFLLGDDLTYMDFYLFELLQLADYITQGEIYAAYKHLDSYQYAISQLPRLKRYLQSPNFISAPFNLKFARINNWRRVV